MKKILYILSIMITFSSCNFLDTETYDYLNEDNIYHDEKSCMAGLAGIYDVLGAMTVTVKSFNSLWKEQMDAMDRCYGLILMPELIF